MENKIINEDAVGRLIVSRLSGTISPEEEVRLDSWIEEADDHRLIYNEYSALDRRLRMPLCNNVEEALQMVHTRSGIGRRRRKPVLCVAGALAVLGLIAGLVHFYVRIHDEKSVQRIVNVDNTSMHCVLPDGSDVWLRAGSELAYDGSFNTTSRIVTLKGEAYFDVESNPECPFYVKADDYKVKVLGTVFNVKNYEDTNVEVTLAKGAVAMQTSSGHNLFCLKPGQKASFVPAQEAFDITETPIENILLMKYGIMSMTNASVDDIVSVIEQEMGVDIVYKGDADPHKRYNFNFQKGASPESVVELLGFICTGLTFEIKK